MNSKTMPLERVNLAIAGLRKRRIRRPNRPRIELLEQRLMLSGDVPAEITVGRTLSSWTAAGIRDNQLQITYSVYNEQASELSGVLLATTLQPGVSFVTASQSPDSSGQELAWSLGTLAPFAVASVVVTVALPATTPLQIDAGARAFGTVSATAVSDSAPPATLRPGAVPDDLLASTPDANTTDPFVQREAAELDYDPQRIIDFLSDDIAYESYVGSLRGARGTLWSAAGNALDEASLGVALLRASGVPARYAQGTLPDAAARQLILSMFASPSGAIGQFPQARPSPTPPPIRDSWPRPATTTGSNLIPAAASGISTPVSPVPRSARPLPRPPRPSRRSTTASGTRQRSASMPRSPTPPPPCSGSPASRRRRYWRRHSTTWTSSGDC